MFWESQWMEYNKWVYMYDILIEKMMEGAKSYKQTFDCFLQISDYTNYSSCQIL